MPRVFLTGEQRRAARIKDGDDAFRAALTARLAATQQTQRELAGRIDIDPARFTRIKQSPGTLRLEVFRDIAHATGMTDEMILAVVKGRRL